MKVHPRYHNNRDYIEPELYGFAKYNLHYHEVSKVNSIYNYKYLIGERILVKNLCNQNLMLSNPAYISALYKDKLYITSTLKESTNRSKIEVSNSIYTRVNTVKNSNYIYNTSQPGFITSDYLKALLKHEDIINLNLRSRLLFYKLHDWYLLNVEVIGNNNESIPLDIGHIQMGSNTENTLYEDSNPINFEPSSLEDRLYTGNDILFIRASNSEDQVVGNSVVAKISYSYLI